MDARVVEDENLNERLVWLPGEGVSETEALTPLSNSQTNDLPQFVEDVLWRTATAMEQEQERSEEFVDINTFVDSLSMMGGIQCCEHENFLVYMFMMRMTSLEEDMPDVCLSLDHQVADVRFCSPFDIANPYHRHTMLAGIGTELLSKCENRAEVNNPNDFSRVLRSIARKTRRGVANRIVGNREGLQRMARIYGELSYQITPIDVGLNHLEPFALVGYSGYTQYDCSFVTAMFTPGMPKPDVSLKGEAIYKQHVLPYVKTGPIVKATMVRNQNFADYWTRVL